MGMLLSLLFALFLRGTLSIRVNQEINEFKNPALHLPLYHAQGQLTDSPLKTTLSFLDALALDDARVKFLNSKLNKKNTTAVHPAATTILTGSDQFINRKSVSAPLNPGEPLGVANYYTKIGLGTPPTYHLVVVDTGSSFSWIQCEPCEGYCHPQVGPHFNPSASNTYQKVSCNTNECSSLKGATLNSPACSRSNTCIYTATYGDQSFSAGYLSRDSLTFGSDSISGFAFGCGQENNGLFGKSAGLVGLAKNPLSMLYQLSVKHGKAFSYCLPSATLMGQTGSGGFLSIGVNSNPGLKFTPMLSNSRDPTLYFVKLSSITVSGKPIGVAASSGYSVPTIIDSGTTISRLSTPVYTALRAALVKIISSKFKMVAPISILDGCFAGSFSEISASVPEVVLMFEGGAELDLKPQNVVLEVEKGTTCLSFAGNSNLEDIAIIGNQQQQTFEVVYDIDTSKIGFAAGGCR